MNRRDLLKFAVASTAMAALDSIGDQIPSSSAGGAGQLGRRAYGKEGILLSILGFPGIAVSGMEQGRADRLVAEAIERGVNYFDVAPSYDDAELRLGPALKPYRRKVFLACKTNRRDRERAEAELQRSLERFETDYFDLYQVHGISEVAKDVDAVFVKDGVMAMLIAAKKEGRIRHLGFSAHSEAAALAAMERYDFDSVLFPLNFACFFKGKFGGQILSKAKEKNVSRLAIKMLARQHWPMDDPQRKGAKVWYQPVTDRQEAELALRFTLSQDITAAMGPGEESLFRVALELAGRFRPITAEETRQLRGLAQGLKPLFAAV